MNILDNIIITPMKIEDAKSLENILIEKFDDFWNYSIFCEEIGNTNSSYIVAKLTSQENIIVGFAGIKKILDEADIMNIVVRKHFRHNGIATQLLNNLCVLAKSQNCNTITLEVNEKNIYAIKLYQKHGFLTVGKRKNYYNGTDSAIIMTKTLT